MAKPFKGSQTEKNLLASFAGESQARNRYTYFASAARKVAEVYFSDRWLLSRIVCTFTPRLCALTRALAIGADVKEYA